MSLVRFTRRQPRIAFPGFSNTTPFPAFLGFDDVENRVNRFIERMFNEPIAGMSPPESIGWVPAMDIVETPKEITLTAKLPGIDQKDIDVSVENGVLTVRGEKSEERKDEEEKKIYLFERSYGSFQRAFALPNGVDGSTISAEFDKGVLWVHVPKNGPATPKGQKIEIKSAPAT
jgi:HSP20 family protein